MSAHDEISLLDGGAEAFPRMLLAIEGARRRVHLEIYTFLLDEVGSRFLAALSAAARRGVLVDVVMDGWGSAEDGEAIAAQLRAAGAEARIFNPMSRLFFGKMWRNHRKILSVDDEIAFLGGINISDEYDTTRTEGWADLAISLRGPAAAWLGRYLRGEKVPRPAESSARIWLSERGGGGWMRRRYLKAIGRARRSILIAHAYFLPDRRLVRSLTAAARRGVSVSLLLAGRSDVFLSRAATMRLYQQFLRAGVRIFEWSHSILHAKAAVVDRHALLVGSFNLDPFSLSNLEALVEVTDSVVASDGAQWISERIAGAREITLAECVRSPLQALVLDRLGLFASRMAQWISRLFAPHRSHARHREAAAARRLPSSTR